MSHDDAHMDCSQALYRMMEYVDGEMTLDDTKALAAHLTNCAPCLAEHDLDRVLRDLVQRSCACEPAPPRLRATIMERITTICEDGSWSEVTQVRQISTDG
ncbi:mycothiol system anti-sigma-R factor [Janibacter anophelis]|uniref:mycothiol system anti-sigma-R factor n=1 Tax=Janibacter anophelis TaxID=319054 RepID=UPI003F81E0B3